MSINLACVLVGSLSDERRRNRSLVASSSTVRGAKLGPSEATGWEWGWQRP